MPEISSFHVAFAPNPKAGLRCANFTFSWNVNETTSNDMLDAQGNIKVLSGASGGVERRFRFHLGPNARESFKSFTLRLIDQAPETFVPQEQLIDFTVTVPEGASIYHFEMMFMGLTFHCDPKIMNDGMPTEPPPKEK